MANRKKTLDQVEVIGVDVGGSKIEIILWKNGRILKSKRLSTPKSKAEFLDALIKGIKGVMGEKARIVRGVGVAVAGVIDYKRGIILNSPNLKFLNGTPLARILNRELKKEVKIDNDTRCFLLAESKFGQAQGKKAVVALTIGTGVGGAVMMDGKIMHGAHGGAGEIGHTVIKIQNSPPEADLSLRLMRLGSTPLAEKSKFQKLDLEDLITVDRRDFVRIGKYLGIGLANIVNVFDPELIILGGGVSNDAKKFLPQALREMKKYTVLPPKYLPKVRISRLKHVGALGAVSLFF